MDGDTSCDFHKVLPSEADNDCVHGCGCDANIQSWAKSLILKDGRAEEDITFTVCGARCNGNMQVLSLTLGLFGTVTAFQTVGALVAHSEAMLADSCAMWVDCMTYALNILAEACQGRWFEKYLKTAIPAISLTTLIYATTCVLQDAISELKGEEGDDDDDDVNPYIVLGFSLWCMCFDFTALVAFFRNHRRSTGKSGVSINMLVACSHVAADFCRSVTTIVESMLIMVFKFDGKITDAWACVVVSMVILLGTLFPIWKWLRAVREVFC